jgi:hypothetical protein
MAIAETARAPEPVEIAVSTEINYDLEEHQQRLYRLHTVIVVRSFYLSCLAYLILSMKGLFISCQECQPSPWSSTISARITRKSSSHCRCLGPGFDIILWR